MGTNSAVNTAHLANQSLQLGTDIADYGLGTVADAWGLIQVGIEADPVPPMPQSQVDAIKKAHDILYVRPGVPTRAYQDFRNARAKVTALPYALLVVRNVVVSSPDQPPADMTRLGPVLISDPDAAGDAAALGWTGLQAVGLVANVLPSLPPNDDPTTAGAPP